MSLPMTLALGSPSHDVSFCDRLKTGRRMKRHFLSNFGFLTNEIRD